MLVIQDQIKEDYEYDQMTLKEYIDSFMGELMKKNLCIWRKLLCIIMVLSLAMSHIPFGTILNAAKKGAERLLFCG